MVYLLIGVAVVFWIYLAGRSLCALVDGGYIAKTLAVLFWIANISAAAYFISNEAGSGPCVQYETQMHFNAATKTMMPARVCVLRGEWVE